MQQSSYASTVDNSLSAQQKNIASIRANLPAACSNHLINELYQTETALLTCAESLKHGRIDVQHEAPRKSQAR
jgi:hypothetical protein